ncbi:iron chelate uptake ABC transporter family permease subunit [Pontibacillus yanchengensis]|uniref:Iron chelate uptake ABC transporter family permease subunit n=3 Tax=Pontibacillus yanchengensis TaxID=462910 RepID=A0A6I5A4E8_9BACI|nr:iron ABC transporter permease [Pontibacillus yanchengensis]MYL35198.1 iron chelate uptake ABC transporter family permease subunit [Pontibacillus yanchengensis]MYL54808.1 iron chelate uptake ABC transporter family permease subunit [Pontibacillus yanchengensis]
MISNENSIAFYYKFILGVIVLVASFFVAMVLGAADISVRQVWLAITTSASTESANIIQEIRLPREVAAIVVGMALAVAGAIMQGMTRNPLADPGLLGLTAGANAALALTMALLPSVNYFGIMIACFIGAGVGSVMVFGIGSIKKGGFSPFRIVLAGAAVSALLTAIAEGIGLYFNIAKDVSMWTAGGLIGTTWDQVQTITPVIVLGLIVAIYLSRQLTVLSLNDELAVGLGQKTTRVKLTLFIIIILLAGSAVALVGNMAFIGLMIPHIVRPIVGNDYRYIIPMSALFGSAFMLLADTIGRTINAPYETPVASVVAIIGLPFFLFIVNKGGKTIS